MRWIAVAALAACSAAGAVAVSAAPELTPEQIVEKNLAARGGEDAWRRIETMVWLGHMESPGSSTPSVAFVLQQKRPNKTRFEANAMGQKTLRVFDGRHGWKAHPGQDGRPDVLPFSPQELRFAQQQIVIDSPLMNRDSKRVAVDLDGIDQVEGRKAYRLIVRTPSGERHDVWVDAETFLDLKYDRTSYNPSGAPVTVSMLYRDYQTVEGVKIPAIVDIGSGAGKASERMVIEKIAVNPPLNDRLFARPGGPNRRATVTIEPEYGAASQRRARSPAAAAAPGPAVAPVASPEAATSPK
jgi:hypothetical protein